MSTNSPISLQQSENLNASLPALQAHLQGFLAEYEDKVAQARAQLAHVEALLGSLPTETPQTKFNRHRVSNYPSQKALKTKRQSLFGSDKGKISIGERFNEPLTEFQDYI
jgi:hypothetical protein